MSLRAHISAPRLFWFVLFVAIILFRSRPIPAGAEMVIAPAAAADAFALALKVDRSAVNGVRQITLSNAPVSSLLVGLYKEKDRWWSGVASIVPCGKRRCLGQALRLLPADSIQVLDLVELKGKPRTIRLTEQPGSRDIDLGRTSTPRSPALLVKVIETRSAAQETLFLVSISGSLKVIWQEMIRSVAADGGGYQTFAMRLEDARAEYLSIVLDQTTLPRRDEQPALPGPPLALKFLMKDGAYKRSLD